MNFRNLRLATKQAIGFGFILVAMLGVNVFSLNKMAALKAEIDEVTSNWLPRVVAIADIHISTSKLRTNQLQYASAGEARRQEQTDIIITLLDRINENLDIYGELKTQSEEKALYSEEERQLYEEEFDPKWDQYQELSFAFFRFLRENKTSEAIALLNGAARSVYDDFSVDLEKLVGVNQQGSFAAAERAAETYRSTHKVLPVLLIATILLSAVMAAGLVRFITVPVQKLVRAAESVAAGDLEVRLDIRGKDEIGHLSQSFNQMTTALREAKVRMQQQAAELHATNRELEKQNNEIEQKNRDLETAMEELRNTQQQLVLKEKMASLGDLVAGVAHEINTPIGTVNSSADVCGRCVDKIEVLLDNSKTLEEIVNNPQLPRTLNILKDNIRVTSTAGDRIAAIVKSLRNFSRLDEAEYQVADLHEGIESSLTLLGSELRNRILVSKDYGDIPEIACYAGRLNQVFINLLKNAAQAIEGSGTIGIKSFVEGDRIHLQISDSGRGIAAAQLARIFDFGFSAVGGRVRNRD